MPDNQQNHTLTEEQLKEVRDAMAASEHVPTTKKEHEEIERKLMEKADVILDAYKDDLLKIIRGVEKSAYATVLDNDRTSERIFGYLKKNSAVNHIKFESQLSHLVSIVEDHRTQQDRRNAVAHKAEEQGEAALTNEERAVLESKTPLETMLQSITKSYFEKERLNCLDMIKRETRLYEERVRKSPEKFSPDTLKRGIKVGLYGFGTASVKNQTTRKLEDVPIFRFSEKDLPRFVYDGAALDEYVKSYDKYVRTHMNCIEREVVTRELGRNLNAQSEELATMGRDPSYNRLTKEEFSAAHDELEQKCKEAREKYESYVSETESNPAYRAHRSSPEYLTVLNLEYYDRKYENKRPDQIPDYEKPIYVANKYANVGNMNLHRLPAEEKALFDKGILIQAMPHVLEMEANMDKLEKTMGEIWKNSRNTAEQEFQKQELEENKAILSAYKQYAMSGSKEDKQKFYIEFTKAYDTAKQNYINNPEMRDRFEFRADQLRHGDFSIVPLASKKDSIRYGMTAMWDERMRSPIEKYEIAKLPRSNAQKQYERAFMVNVDPLNRKSFVFEVRRDAQKRPELTLKQMGQRLEGADLEDYKARIHNEKMEKFNETVDNLNASIKEAKDRQKALAKHYGFISRFFNKNYRNQKALLDHNIDLYRKEYDQSLKQTKYDILKTYQEKGLALTKKELKEFNSIVKEATANGRILAWDETRANEKKHLDEMNAKWNTREETQTEMPKVSKTIQLDLGDRIRAPKVKEQPVREAPQAEKQKEVEERVKEDQDLEK